ncbi:hypothetical protein BC830DRAFT_464934 [Chytriomyces sp. MP71]|nr:hypothetical protein BC830DRAFT_464934 [Chytriomyces sp. MP71]
MAAAASNGAPVVGVGAGVDELGSGHGMVGVQAPHASHLHHHHQPMLLHQQSVCKLYVGNLDARVDELALHQLFNLDSQVDLIENIKIIPQHGGVNYGFVEYRDAQHAENAIQALNGKKLLNLEIRVNWAFAGSSTKEDLSSHFHIFVGDLGSEINDQLLAKAFAAFGSLSDARVMWDPMSGKSRGYGFVAFKEKADAERAISSMNNEWLGSRTVRVNWANQKAAGSRMDNGHLNNNNHQHHHQNNHYNGNGNNMHHQNRQQHGAKQEPTTLEAIMAQSHIYNTTVYIGNITPQTQQIDIGPLFSQFGYIRELRLQAEKGFGFVKLDTHESAAMAIFSLNGYNLHGRQLKCSWGKERMPDMNAFHPMGMQSYGMYPPPGPHPAHLPHMGWYFPPGAEQGAATTGNGAPPAAGGAPVSAGGVGAPVGPGGANLYDAYAAVNAGQPQAFWDANQQGQIVNGGGNGYY